MSQYSAPQKFKAPVQPSGNSGLAITSLILGLSSFLCSIFTGVIAIVLGIIALTKISSSRGQIGGKGMAIAGIALGAIGSVVSIVLLLVAMLLPAVAQVRTAARRTTSMNPDDPDQPFDGIAVRTAARRITSMNQIRQLSLASLNYESQHFRFPSDFPTADPTSGANLSWRVHILPFLGEQQLYDQFRLDEPWDSSHNLALAEQMPTYYKHPSLELPPGQTVYQMVSSSPNDQNATVHVEGEPGTPLSQISDGISNTVLIVEVNAEAAVPWTQPQDWKFDPSNPTRSLGNNWNGGTTLVGMCDGSVNTIDINNDSPGNISSMMTKNANDGPPTFRR